MMKKTLQLLTLVGTSILGGCNNKEYPYQVAQKNYQGVLYEVVQYDDGVVFVHMPKVKGELTKKLVNNDRDAIPDWFNMAWVDSSNPRIVKITQRMPTEEEIKMFRELTTDFYR